MYRRTTRQVSLLDPAGSLPESARNRLRASWAEGFLDEVYPVLLSLEDEFGDLYGAEGRPNWSVARMLGLLLLQEMLSVPDQVALDALSFDLRWQRALALDPAEAYLSRRSLVSFRARLTSHDPEGARVRKVFVRLTTAARDRLSVAFSELRLDSTHIVSNIRTRGRYALFASTLEVFVRFLQQEYTEHLALLPKGLLDWHARPGEGAFGVLGAAEELARLPQLARWLVDIRDDFSTVTEVRDTEPYALVKRLVEEHIRIRTTEHSGDEGDDPGTQTDDRIIEVCKPAKPSAALQSPHDPDAGFGYKGTGYEVQIVETCNNPCTELILDFVVQRSGECDQGQAAAAFVRLEGMGIVPRILYADAGYVSAEALLDAEARAVDLHGPVSRGSIPDEAIGRDRWTTDPVTGLLARCPSGHVVERHAERSNPSGEVTRHAYISGQQCRGCPLLGNCLVRPPNNGKTGSFHIEDSQGLLLRDRRLAAAKTAEWKGRYAIRSGIEATNSELKRKHGLARLRVRRRPRVVLAVTFKIAACNVKRWLRR